MTSEFEMNSLMKLFYLRRKTKNLLLITKVNLILNSATVSQSDGSTKMS